MMTARRDPWALRPLFAAGHRPQPYEKEHRDLDRLAAEGPSAAKGALTLLQKVWAEVPDTLEARQREATTDPVRFKARRELLRRAYSELARMVSLAGKEPKPLRHACWSAALSSMRVKKIFVPEADELPKALFRAMVASGRPDDLELMKQFLVRPELGARVKDGLGLLAKKLPPAEIQRWSLRLLPAVATGPKKDLNLTKELLRQATPGHLDDAIFRTVCQILRRTKDPDIELGCARFLAKWADLLASFRKTTEGALRESLTPSDAATTSWALNGLSKCGHVASLRAVLKTSSSPAGHELPTKIEGAICRMLDWPSLGASASAEQTEEWTRKTVKRAGRLANALSLDPKRVPPGTSSAGELSPPEAALPSPRVETSGMASPLEKLRAVAKDPDKDTKLTLSLLAEAPCRVDDTCPEVVARILKGTRDRAVRLACLGVLKRCADSVEAHRETSQPPLRKALRTADPRTRGLAVYALAKTGDLKAIETIYRLLADRNLKVRYATARGIAFLLGWPRPKAGASEIQIDRWFDWLKGKAEDTVPFVSGEAVGG